AVSQLKNGLAEFYTNDFEVAAVNYGRRPTVKDRRPILGRHPEAPNFFVFNGLGARGILNGCYFARELFQFIEKGKPLMSEVNLKRFDIKNSWIKIQEFSREEGIRTLDTVTHILPFQ